MKNIAQKQPTHFNCTTGYPVSIDRNKVNDYGLDCADLFGECRENYVSSAKQMIKNLRKLKNFDGKNLTKCYNLLFLLNLALYGVIFGFILAVIAFNSNMFSGTYCSKYFEWRQV